MKKTYLLLIILSCTLISSAQQNLKEMIGVVHPVYPESTVRFLSDFSKSLRNRGYKQAAALMDSYSKGGFGTGFIIKSKTGQYYLITNRHVVQSAKYVNVEFINKRDTVRYTECKVEAIDPNIDLALVKLPNTAKFNDVLSISDSKLYDGQDVFTAGFPGLGNKPSWQFGKGIVSNSELFDKDMINNNDAYIIQHTAQIDHGSSGGPLLIKNDNGTFDIVGVNTWKAINRENTNFSIPSNLLNKFLSTYLDKDRTLNKELLQQQLDKFVSKNINSYKDVIPYIAYSYIANLNIYNYYDLVNSLPDDIVAIVNRQFKKGRPIYGVRIALAYEVYNRIKNKGLTIKNIKEVSADNKNAIVVIQEGDKEVDTKWIAEQGHWRLFHMPSIKTNKLRTKNGIDNNFGYDAGVFLLTDIPNSNLTEKNYLLMFGINYNPYLFGHIGLGMSFVNTTEDVFNEVTLKMENKEVKYKGLTLQANGGAQLPITIQSITILPNIQVLTGLTFVSLEKYGSMYTGITFGSRFAYKIHDYNYLMAGIGYKMQYYYDEEICNDKKIFFSLGITF